MWWLGQSGFLVQSRGRHLLIDPYLSDSLTKKYAANGQAARAHDRTGDRSGAARLHRRGDVQPQPHRSSRRRDPHPAAGRECNLTLVIPEANRAFVAERLGSPPTGLSAWTTAGRPRWRASASTPWRRRTSRSIATPPVAVSISATLSKSGAYASITAATACCSRACGPHRAVCGRCGAAAHQRDGPERRVAGNFSGREAAWLAHEIHARLAVPMHYDLFDFNTASPDEFVAESRRLGVSRARPAGGRAAGTGGRRRALSAWTPWASISAARV